MRPPSQDDRNREHEQDDLLERERRRSAGREAGDAVDRRKQQIMKLLSVPLV